jgi:hypothetical protein
LAADAVPFDVHRQPGGQGQVQAAAKLIFVHARELDVPGVGLHLVAEGQEGF